MSPLKIGNFFEAESHLRLEYVQKYKVTDRNLVVFLAPTHISGLKDNWIMRFTPGAQAASQRSSTAAMCPSGRNLQR